jgi:superfamily II DNA/RNA helicase
MSEVDKLITSLRKSLLDPGYIKNNSFDILSKISSLSGSEENTVEFQELILRALEFKEYFLEHIQILNSLVRQVGLFPYLEEKDLILRDQIAYEYHKPANLDDDIVFHSAQGEIYRRIKSGENIALSAPTSYGKSLIIDAIIATGEFSNIVIIVPTIALIDETRRRLTKRFRNRYKIITRASQSLSDKNIYVLTQERLLELENLDHIEFFVIDEFYKLASGRDEDDRTNLLNLAFKRLKKSVKRFYMLGPSIENLSIDFQNKTECKFVFDDYQTVVSQLYFVRPLPNKESKLIEICKEITGPTSIFCASPNKASNIAKMMVDEGLGRENSELKEAAEWIANHYHPDWHFVMALKRGIGIHHGKIPRALAQYIVRKYNDGEIDFMICTSTLIEGVNTKAKNMIVYDNKINRNYIDFFTFNNIKGRTGRMMEHFIGNVFIFYDPPDPELPLVDIPAYTQDDKTSEALLIQLDEDDLSDESKARIKRFKDQDILNYEIIKQNTGVDPDAQLQLANTILNEIEFHNINMAWSKLPDLIQLRFICNLIWNHFNGFRYAQGSVNSYKQLAFLLSKLGNVNSIKELIQIQLKWEKEADKAVSHVLDFLRNWAMFHFPRLLMAVDIIQKDIFARFNMPAGDYQVFASKVENLFLDPSIIALDEYGVPLELARKLSDYLESEGDLDVALENLRGLPIDALELSSFEYNLLCDAISYL